MHIFYMLELPEYFIHVIVGLTEEQLLLVLFQLKLRQLLILRCVSSIKQFSIDSYGGHLEWLRTI